MQEDMYREYVDRIERIHDEKILVENQMRQLDDFTNEIKSLDYSMDTMMEELFLTNRDDYSFIKELEDINNEMIQARISVDKNIGNKYEEYTNEVKHLTSLEEQVEQDYREYMYENNNQEDVY